MGQTIAGAAAAVAAVLIVGLVLSPESRPAPVVVADDGGAIESIAIHFDPAAAGEVAATYRDLLRALPASVAVRVVVAHAGDFDRFDALLGEWDIDEPGRFEAVVVGKPITTWSRDRYTLVRRDGRSILLVPPRPTRGNPARVNDWDAPFALAGAVDGVEVDVADLLFEGGDLTATDSHVFATALLRERNRGGDLYEPDALRQWLRRHTGKEPVLIGDSVDEVPGHHIGMFVTPLDDRRVLVGDPDAGIALFDASGDDPAGLPQPIDRSETSLRRFRNVAGRLEARGFEVIRVPLVPLVDGLTYVTYNNALLEHRDGALHAYVPVFDLPELDRAGLAAYEAAGVVVHPISVADVYRHNGTVRCLVNILSRAAI